MEIGRLSRAKSEAVNTPQHLRPERPASSPKPVGSGSPWNTKKVAALAASGVIAGVCVIATIFGGRDGSPGLDVPDAQKTKILWEQLAVLSVELEPVDSADPVAVKQAVEQLDLKAPAREALQKQVADDAVKVGLITLWDNEAEDGDFVEIESSGYRRIVGIDHRPKKYVIPYVNGSSVTITGHRDGGGGITLGLTSGGRQVELPPLEPGQKIILPLH